MQKLVKTFLRGLAVVLPLALTIYILYWMGTTAEALFGGVARWLLPEGAYVPGLGIALGVAAVLVIGITFRASWVRALWSGVENLLARIPLVKTIYGSIKDFMGFFAEGDRKSELDQVVIVRFGSPPLELLGLVTSTDVERITRRGEEDSDRVAVYLPMSYQIGGFMILAPKDALERVDIGVEEALRIIVTAGMSGASSEAR